MRVGLPPLLWLLLWAVPSRAEQELALYPGAVHTRIGTDLLIGGQYHRMAYFTTKDSMGKVARYFHDAWTKQGYPVVVEGDLRQEAVVSAFDTREGLQRAVVLRTHLGKTVGFTVLKDLWLSETPPAADQGRCIPLEWAVFTAGVRARTHLDPLLAGAQVVEHTLDTVRQEVVSKLTAAGYKAVRESGGEREGQRSLLLEFARGAEQTLTTLVEQEPSRVAVSQTWVGTQPARGEKP